MPKKGTGPSVKDKRLYKALRDEGIKKKKAARIANSAAAESGQTVAERGGQSDSYDEWTKSALLARARQVGVTGRSTMTKTQLVEALRS